jgi:hypothetical protein
MAKIRNAYKILARNPEGFIDDQKVKGKIILKFILNNQNWKVWPGFKRPG